MYNDLKHHVSLMLTQQPTTNTRLIFVFDFIKLVFLELDALIKGLADVTQISDVDLRTLICNLIYKIMRNRHSDLNVSAFVDFIQGQPHIYNEFCWSCFYLSAQGWFK